MAIEFVLPALGENIDAADVVSVLVKPGDVIGKDQAVVELETEKAVVELPCPHAGKVEVVHVKPGERIKVGAAVLRIEPSEGESAETIEPAAAPTPVEQAPRPEVAEKTQERERLIGGVGEVDQAAGGWRRVSEAESGERREDSSPVPASPAIRRLAREMGIDLGRVKGSGPAGRITQEDVHAFVRGLAGGRSKPGVVMSGGTAGLPDFSQWGPVRREAISGIRRKTAESMTAAWRMVPQVTQYDVCDITDLEAQRKRYVQAVGEKGPKITMTAILLKATAAVLREHPKFRASLDMEAGEIIHKDYVHIGVAVDTEGGLLVPVIRDVDRKSIAQLARELDEAAEKARGRKLGIDQMRGACFTITNLGGIGGTAFSPIVYWPEVAILGVARARQEEVVRDGRTEIRLMLPLCLSYDHRVIDGADGARFTRRLGSILADPLTLLMEG